MLADTPAIGKGKARELPQPLNTSPDISSATYATSAVENKADEPSPIAGPSTSSLPPNYHPTGRPLGPDPDLPPEPSEIYRLMNDERLLVKGGVKPPKDVVVLCHGEWNVRR
jgi:triacylglycerol lipase